MFRLYRRNLMAAAAAALLPRAASSAPAVLTGLDGQQMRLDLPVRRILLGFYFEDYLAIGGTDAMRRVVGISKGAWKDWRPANWSAYLDVLPWLDDIPDVGEVEVNTFSVEKVIALRPDVAILGDWQVRGLGADVGRITAAGIPVVVVDYHAQTLERHLASTRLIGQVLGAEERADRLAREYQAALRDVEARIAAARRPRPRIYIELGNKGPAEQGVSSGDHMWGAMARLAGGDNIGRGIVNGWAPIAAEQVLASRPDVIVIAGSEWRRHASGQLMGQGVTADEARKRLAGFTRRPGWAALPAVRNGRVHGIYQGASRTLADHTAVQYLAKALYPDLFTDMDPAANYLAYHERYLPIRPEGTFMVPLR